MSYKIYFFIFLLPVLISCNNLGNDVKVTKEEVSNYSEKLGIPADKLFFINEGVQKQVYDKGQPYLTVYDKNFNALKIGTCYEEFPFFIDTFLLQKAQVVDTMSFYASGERPIREKIKDFSSKNGTKISIDTSKKYHVFYHFALYAKELDEKKLPPMYERYKDSVQFFFINVDKIKP